MTDDAEKNAQPIEYSVEILERKERPKKSAEKRLLQKEYEKKRIEKIKKLNNLSFGYSPVRKRVIKYYDYSQVKRNQRNNSSNANQRELKNDTINIKLRKDSPNLFSSLSQNNSRHSKEKTAEDNVSASGTHKGDLQQNYRTSQNNSQLLMSSKKPNKPSLRDLIPADSNKETREAEFQEGLKINELSRSNNEEQGFHSKSNQANIQTCNKCRSNLNNTNQDYNKNNKCNNHTEEEGLKRTNSQIFLIEDDMKNLFFIKNHFMFPANEWKYGDQYAMNSNSNVNFEEDNINYEFYYKRKEENHLSKKHQEEYELVNLPAKEQINNFSSNKYHNPNYLQRNNFLGDVSNLSQLEKMSILGKTQSSGNKNSDLYAREEPKEGSGNFYGQQRSLNQDSCIHNTNEPNTAQQEDSNNNLSNYCQLSKGINKQVIQRNSKNKHHIFTLNAEGPEFDLIHNTGSSGVKSRRGFTEYNEVHSDNNNNYKSTAPSNNNIIVGRGDFIEETNSTDNHKNYKYNYASDNPRIKNLNDNELNKVKRSVGVTNVNDNSKSKGVINNRSNRNIQSSSSHKNFDIEPLGDQYIISDHPSMHSIQFQSINNNLGETQNHEYLKH
eukprot:CAMPEP_0170537588 /NCGR_PEP_ID=MMETSP0209-20121228/102808_1 /TAXON_ID=665100 ORGANISM="Litonotus pictus, Strain P1" /NCGR_SAMPLE_ID=MMETSP0209 /ASSEMBLY_ACC=CAM_ASM_000301 /LENGTH=608 /DNA_ID=CAMNT_0010839119 /DNA_START=231 /DNA_END=2057 /DNA_ORIENTATION=+